MNETLLTIQDLGLVFFTIIAIIAAGGLVVVTLRLRAGRYYEPYNDDEPYYNVSTPDPEPPQQQLPVFTPPTVNIRTEPVTQAPVAENAFEKLMREIKEQENSDKAN